MKNYFEVQNNFKKNHGCFAYLNISENFIKYTFYFYKIIRYYFIRRKSYFKWLILKSIYIYESEKFM